VNVLIALRSLSAQEGTNMSGPGFSRNNKAGARTDAKQAPQQKLRVLSQDGSARTAPPSVAMPRAKTELSEMLADDAMLCLRRRVTSVTAVKDAPAESSTTATLPPVGEPQAGDEELARVIDAWPSLPRNIRTAVVAMIGNA
jgi:hypothetical protein